MCLVLLSWSKMTSPATDDAVTRRGRLQELKSLWSHRGEDRRKNRMRTAGASRQNQEALLSSAVLCCSIREARSKKGTTEEPGLVYM